MTDVASDGPSRPGWRETVENAAERAGEVASETRRSARRLKDEAAQALRDAQGQVETAYGRTAERAQLGYRRARSYAQENPGTTAVVALVAGIGLGIMLAPRERPQRARTYRGLIPVVAIALAQAALDVFAAPRVDYRS